MADTAPKMKADAKPKSDAKPSDKPKGLGIETEYVGPVGGNEEPPGTGIPPKDWKPGRGRAGANGNFTPGFVKERVQETYYTLALAVSPFLPMTGQALYQVSQNAAEVAEDWAQSDPKFREFILKLLKTSHGVKFAMANAPVLMAAFSEVKNRRSEGDGAGRVEDESGDASSVPGFPTYEPPAEASDFAQQVFKRQQRTAKPDAQNFTYKVPDHAVV